MPIDIQERLKRAQQQAAANDRANVDAARNITPGLRVSGSNSIAPIQAQQQNDYSGLGGFLRGMGENALEGIRSANAGFSAWLADAGDWLAEHTGGLIDPGANISLVDTDPQAAAAAARAATSAIRETAADTEKDREYWRQQGQEAKDYLGERQEEIDTGEDVEILTQKGVDAQQRAAEIREAALEGRGFVGQVLFDVGSTGLQWVYDALLGALIPGGALASAGLRGAGSGMLEARLAGANLGQQLLYGIGTGGVEVLTEKISNISNTLTRVFGKGFSDGVVNRLINRLTTNATGRSVLRTLASAGGEGVEEMVSDVVNPFLQLIYDGDALDQMGTWDYWGDVLYDGLVGSVFGGVVQGAETGVNRLRGNRGGNTAQTSTDTQPAQTTAPNIQTGADTTTPAETAAEAPTAPQTATEVEALLSSGTVSNSVAERIITTPELRAQFEALAGQQLTGTKSEMRNTIKEFARQRAADAAVEQFEADVAEMNGESVAQAQQAANVSEIPNSSPVQDVNTPVMPDSSAVSPTDSLGAAPAGFDRFSAALNRYGEMPERGTGAREMSIPRAMNDSTVVPQTVQTFANAGATPESTYTEITRLLEEGGFDHAVITDQASLARAEETITRDGFNRALADWTATVRSGRVSKDTTTLGLTLYNNAINAGDVQTGIQILVDIVDNARDAAQATQAVGILNKLTPEGRLYGIQRSIARLQADIQRRFGDKAPNIKIDEALASEYLNAPDEDARLEALDNIYKDVARQVPSDWYDKFNAWRYFAMLANPRTHVRNFAGNAFMRVISGVRDRLSGAMQSAFVRDRNQRTRSNISRAFNAEDAARYNVAYDEYKRVSAMIADAGKYSNELNQIRKHMQPIKGVLGKLANANSKLLEWGDTVFSRGAYARSLAQFLKARGITAEQYVNNSISQEVKAEAQAFAIQEAQRATFRDFNAFSNLIQQIARAGGNTGAGRVWQTVVGSVLPFTRTPANIVVRGVADYSPIGIMRGVGNLLTSVRKGNMTAGEAIDKIASGLTGTGLMALGALLSKLGLVSGGEGGDEQEQAYNELTGFQPYALQVDGKSYTLDWLAPAALPFFTGVEIQKLFQNSGADDGDLLQALGSITQPMLEMSMLSGVNDLLDSVSYAQYNGTSPIWAALSSAATSYISQYFPSVFGAIERTIEDQRYTTYTDPNSPVPDDFQYAISQALNRAPGEYNQIPYINAWGETESTGSTGVRALENFLSPGYYSELMDDPLTNELMEIYEETGEAVIPERVTMSTKVDGERLTPENFEEYATTLGQTQREMLEDLTSYAFFDRMSSDEKAAAVQDIYEYAKHVAADAIGRETYSPMSDKAMTAETQGIDPVQYLLWYRDMGSFESDKDANGDTISGSKKAKVVSYIDSLSLTPEQKDWLYLHDRGYAASGLDETPWHQR